MFEGKSGSLGGLVAAAVLGASLPAHAQPLHNLTPFGEDHGAANPPVAHYLASQGRSFVLDRLAVAPEALLKFDDNFEVWVLEPSIGPGGVTFYSNDSGDRMARVTRLGGVTLYTQREPEGVPASLQGEADEILPPPVLPLDVMSLRMLQAEIRVGRAVQGALGVAQASKRQIFFSASDMRPQWRPIFTESIDIVADAIVKLSRDKKAKAFLAKLDTVQFTAGSKPEVSISGPVMTITLTPAKGFAGRPSSERIMKVCLKH